LAPPFIACTDIGMSPCRDEDDWDFLVCCGELVLKIKSALPRQSDVEYSGTFRRIGLEKVMQPGSPT
jgi:hypothetical protein